MGQDESHPYHSQELISQANLTQYCNISNDKIIQSYIKTASSFLSNYIRTSGFYAYWHVENQNAQEHPDSLSGHFTASDGKYLYIGYGQTKDKVPNTDIWKLNLASRKWEKLPLHGELRSPRNGSRAIILGNYIVIFGGYYSGTYYGDLHYVNLKTSEVSSIKTNGLTPSPRSSPLIDSYNGKIFIWGGFDGTFPTELNILDINTLTWRNVPTNIQGRTGIPHVKYNNKIIAYGNSSFEAYLEIDMDKETVNYVQTTGVAPPPKKVGSSMAVVGKYVLYFGGKSKHQETFIYALDIERSWWFILNVLPDGETVSFERGKVTDNGLFMLPRKHSFSMEYCKQTRELIITMGAENPDNETWVFSMEKAISGLNHREDMLLMLKC
ncbi:Kelch motif family protein [Histomonas meleagridis]|uniref:Kelch motif family protein n=1 Tax=Histomonas meleagridis TaxID=135588 RepID=UPI003559C552|nr:Kelch motif family protein [Histomonas meleagridis]KAH0804361.1 Kelch motif family protein [Histomonas meleagridis]